MIRQNTFTSDFGVSMVYENNGPQIVSPEASHLASLHWRLLLDAVHRNLEHFSKTHAYPLADASWKFGD